MSVYRAGLEYRDNFAFVFPVNVGSSARFLARCERADRRQISLRQENARAA